MEQIGLVTKVFDTKVEVEVKRMSGWGENCKGCGNSSEDKKHILILENNIDAKVGDMVEIEGDSRNILKYMFIIYFIPFIMMLAGIFIGIKVFQERGIANYEPLSFLLGLVTLAIGFLIVRITDKKFGDRDTKIVRMIKIL